MVETQQNFIALENPHCQERKQNQEKSATVLSEMADIQMIEGTWALDGADKGGFNKRMDSNCLNSWKVPTCLHNLWKKKKVADYYWNHLSCLHNLWEKKVADYYWNYLSYTQNFPGVNEIYVQRTV